MTEQKKDTRSRDWMLTMPYEAMSERELERELSPYTYIGQQEISNTGYHHWHVYIQNDTAIRFSTLKRKFPKAHLEVKKGSSQQLYDYVTKSDTQVPNSRIENGEIKLSDRGAAKMDFESLRAKIEGGMSYDDLIVSEVVPSAYLNGLREYHAALQRKKLKNQVRNVEVNYLYGESGTGKTHMLYEKYGFDDVYRVSNYKNPFDSYNGEDVLILDEFYESLPFEYSLNVLDKWPLQLSARYSDRWAGYTKVWIVSNWKVEFQYREIRRENLIQYKPFIRRIKNNYIKTREELILDNSYLDSLIDPNLR